MFRLFIPVSNSDELVQVDLDDAAVHDAAAQDARLDDIIDVLKAEAAPLALWLDFARAYLAQGLTTPFVRLLNEATSEEAAGYFGEQAKYERIQGLCSLAAFHAHQSRVEKERNVRSDLLARANELLNTARKLDHEEQLPHLGIGQLALAKGDVEGARKEFERASKLRSNGRPSVAGLLALAGLQFGQGNYKEALDLYRKALSEFPDCPADVRLGLAACYFKLGNTAKAAAAYERVLDLDPSCTQALLGLAVLRLSLGAGESAVREGSQLLTQAFQNDPDNPYVLVLLAHFCLQQGFHDKARRLAGLALERTDVDAVRAESLTVLARAHHGLGQLREAYTLYRQAHQLDQRLPLPMLGLAQMSVLQGETTNAVSILELLLTELPGWYDALQLLGRLYPRLAPKGGGAKGAAERLREATTRHGQRAELWEMLGDVLAAADPSGALNAYQKAIDLYRKHPDQHQQQLSGPGNGQLANGHAAVAGAAAVPARLLNNAAVLHLRQGSGGVARARQLMEEALASAREGGLQQLGALTQVTLGYNMARVREAGGELQAAEAEYRALLEQFPDYADCYLRLACVAKLRGNTREALSWAQKASDITAHSADSLALRASLFLERRDYPNAKQVLDELLEAAGEGAGGAPNSAAPGGAGASASGRLEAYGKLAMANLHLCTAPADRRRDDQRRKAESHLSHALELYRRVLEKDQGNVYAANGIGCVFAEAGNFSSAKEVFLQVQEASAATDGFFRMPDAWVNLAHVQLAQEQYGAAVAMYRNALRRFYEGRNAQLQLYLARAHYDADQVQEAKRVLVKALHLAPTDCSLRFDVALTMQEYAVRTLKQHQEKAKQGGAGAPGASDPARLAQLSMALTELEHAHRFFTQLNTMGTPATGIDSKKLTTHINFIAETHKKARDLVQKAQKEAEIAEAKRREQLSRLEAAQRQKEVEETKRQLLEEAAARQRESLAREHAAKLERLKAEWRESAVLAKAAAEGDSSKVAKGRGKGGGGGPKSKADEAVDALFAVDDEEDDNDYQPGQEDSDAEGAAAAPGGGTTLDLLGLASSGEEEEDADFAADDDEEEDGAGIDFGSDSDDGGQAAAGRKEGKKQRKEDQMKKKKRRKKEKGEGAGAAAAAAVPAAGGGIEKKGRLKKRQRGEEAVAAAVAGLEDVEEDDSGLEGPAGAAGTAGEAAAPAKRQRQAAVLDDDEEEEEEEEGLGPAADAGQAEQAQQRQGQTTADLFGSEDEDE